MSSDRDLYHCIPLEHRTSNRYEFGWIINELAQAVEEHDWHILHIKVSMDQGLNHISWLYFIVPHSAIIYQLAAPAKQSYFRTRNRLEVLFLQLFDWNRVGNAQFTIFLMRVSQHHLSYFDHYLNIRRGKGFLKVCMGQIHLRILDGFVNAKDGNFISH